MELILSHDNGRYYFVTCENNKPVEIDFCGEEDKHILGNIYLGKVKNVVANMELAFVEIAPETTVCVLNNEVKKPVIFNRVYDGKGLKKNDEVLVTVTSESAGDKKLRATCDIKLVGEYMVLSVGYKSHAISSRISDPEERARLKKLAGELIDSASKEQGLDLTMIIRTEAENKDEAVIKDELNKLLDQYRIMCDRGRVKNKCGLIHGMETEKDYLLTEYLKKDYDTVITDDENIAMLTSDKVKTVIHTCKEMSYLYNISSILNKALEKKVWLPCGGNIVIEQTESLVSVDVNSLGAIKGKTGRDEAALKVNLEAATELARQLRLKNLAGIIIVDFINMKNQEFYDILENRLAEELKKDPVGTEFVDFTSIGLAEVIRKRVKLPLRDRYIVKTV